MAIRGTGMIALLWLWTVWLAVGPSKAGRAVGVAFVGLFLLPALVLAFIGSAAWRPYVMVWLALHAVLVATSAFLERRWWPWLALSSASTIGWLWCLWHQSGMAEWLFALAMLGLIVGIAIVLVAANPQEVRGELPAELGMLLAVSLSARWHFDGLQRQISALTAENERIRSENQRVREARDAELRDVVERAARVWKAQQQQRARQAVSRVACCTQCFSLWLVTTYPQRYEVRGPIGSGCALCRQHAAFWPGDSDEPEPAVPRQAERDEPLDEGSTLAEEVVKFTADLIDTKREDALAEHLSELISDPVWQRIHEESPADRCLGLGALADGLDELRDRIQKGVARGVVFCAELVGAPEFAVRLLGEVAGRAVGAKLELLHAMAQTIRVVGAATCLAADALDRCRCADGLVRYMSRDVVKSVIGEQIREAETAVERHLDTQRRDPAEPARSSNMLGRQQDRGPAEQKQERSISKNQGISR